MRRYMLFPISGPVDHDFRDNDRYDRYLATGCQEGSYILGGSIIQSKIDSAELVAGRNLKSVIHLFSQIGFADHFVFLEVFAGIAEHD